MVAANKNADLGTLSVNEIYPLDVFKRLSGLDRWALRQAEREGLKIHKVGRRRYVRGSDFATWLGA